jgi:propionyl-CoA carboxylase beta chain
MTHASPRFPQAYDMKEVVGQVVDDGQLFEIMADYAKNIIIGG